MCISRSAVGFVSLSMIIRTSWRTMHTEQSKGIRIPPCSFQVHGDLHFGLIILLVALTNALCLPSVGAECISYGGSSAIAWTSTAAQPPQESI